MSVFVCVSLFFLFYFVLFALFRCFQIQCCICLHRTHNGIYSFSAIWTRKAAQPADKLMWASSTAIDFILDTCLSLFFCHLDFLCIECSNELLGRWVCEGTRDRIFVCKPFTSSLFAFYSIARLAPHIILKWFTIWFIISIYLLQHFCALWPFRERVWDRDEDGEGDRERKRWMYSVCDLFEIVMCRYIS